MLCLGRHIPNIPVANWSCLGKVNENASGNCMRKILRIANSSRVQGVESKRVEFGSQLAHKDGGVFRPKCTAINRLLQAVWGS